MADGGLDNSRSEAFQVACAQGILLLCSSGFLLFAYVVVLTFTHFDNVVLMPHDVEEECKETFSRSAT